MNDNKTLTLEEMKQAMQQSYQEGNDGRLKPDTRIGGFKVVAVVGGIGDWAAYWGPADWTDQEVANQGIKLTQKSAEDMFSPINHCHFYRD